MSDAKHKQHNFACERYELYTLALQSPQLEARHLASLTDGTWLREDFCGTGALSANWVALSERHRAIGVDIDRPSLDRANSSARNALLYCDRERVEFVLADATGFRSPGVHIVCIPNSSIFLIVERAQLKRYLKNVWDDLDTGGIIVIDMFGGPGAYGDGTTIVADEPFVCIWEQRNFDYRTHTFDALIHLGPDNDSKIRAAFHYHMRLWSVVEITELLTDAGFSDLDVKFSENRLDLFRGNTLDRPDQLTTDEWETSVVGRK